ncbi:Malate/L-lactate dehydrogenase subfamily [Verrucomicrobiia bacterium DG1235]|nr:Malate/L-lactate dehydrogenase subfamily [Verrucomicrobiae bacterium DG1235]
MSGENSSERFMAENLLSFAVKALTRAGLAEDRARVVADVLLDADLMGHSTHGLGLLPLYVGALEDGKMEVAGEPVVLNDRGSTLAWDGRYLPGAWLTCRAIEEGLERLGEHPVVTVTIQKSHHIGSLASYPMRAIKKGAMMLLTCSDPNSELIAPFGGLDAVYSPNPIAAGIPTSGRPVIFDTSMSTTAWGVANRAKQQGERLPGKWMQDNEGKATDDPKVLDSEPSGTILPIGGADHGYKGFALGLLVEALTCGLSGSGRADELGRWGCSTFIQLIDPDAFGGSDAFRREMDYLAKRCHDSRTRPGADAVRLPGERALALREEQVVAGLVLPEVVKEGLLKLSERLGIVL